MQISMIGGAASSLGLSQKPKSQKNETNVQKLLRLKKAMQQAADASAVPNAHAVSRYEETPNGSAGVTTGDQEHIAEPAADENFSPPQRLYKVA
ncbi:MAG: hypothetical protein J5J00_13865 [Deltaproteobacteria bacterium]|nr:hypothetical protein [Deltaproteobacteria bacterium]